MKKTLFYLSVFFTPLISYGQGISMGGGAATGANSFAYGQATTASGPASIAGGVRTVATNQASVAIGEDSESRGDYSIAMGKVAYVGAPNAVAIGSYSSVQSQYSLAFGLNNVIPQNSWYSTAIGAGNHATKDGAIAIGRDNYAHGSSSVAIGTQNTAHSYGEVVLGTYAKDADYTPLDAYGTNPKDRLFVLGNGQSHATRSNALVVLKSGDASFQGGLTIGSLETAIDTTDTKLVVYGGTILSDKADLAEQVLIGTKTRNNEAKLFLENEGYPYAMKIKGKGSSSGTALVVDGNTRLEGNLTVTGTMAKGAGTFKIDHPLDPENKYLYHSFVESPDMMNVYNGNVTTDLEGNATISLPEYFEALNMDYRYQLTPIGQFAQAMVLEKVNANRFKIKTDKPSVEISWQVTGIRNDAYAKHNRVQVSVEKPENEKGTYLHPTAFGKDNDLKTIK